MPMPLPTYSGGTCPAIAPGRNTIRSGGADRQFLLVVPEGLGESEVLPVMTVWHHLGGDAEGILEKGGIQAAVNELRMLAILPEKKGDVRLPIVGSDMCWPFLDLFDDARVEEEARFWEDMLACVAANYSINESCVSTVGVSAGALWTAVLMQTRSERLASAIVLSGGTGPALGLGVGDVRRWEGAAHKLPVLVLNGGDTDQCLVNFEVASDNLEAGLEADGHFIEECVHNCGHAVPPVDPAVGLASLYRFVLDHPYWLSPGTSPYQTSGMPSSAPSWCAIGRGNAVARTGECTETTADSGCPVLP